MRSPAPSIAASLILPAIFWGQGATKRPNIFWFFLFHIVFFRSFIFVIFFFFFSPFYFLLIQLFLSFSAYLFLFFSFFVFLFFSFYILNCLLYYRNDISVILRGFSRSPGLFLIHLGSKLMYTVRPYVLTFLFCPFLLCFISSSWYSLRILLFFLISTYSSLHISSYSSRTIFFLFLFVFVPRGLFMTALQ